MRRVVAALCAATILSGLLVGATSFLNDSEPSSPPRIRPVSVTVVGGARTQDILALLADHTHLTAADLQAAAANPAALGVPKGESSLEGYLGSGNYTIAPQQSAQQVLAAMVERQESAMASAGLAAAAKKRGLSVHQMLTVASIAAAEGIPDDYAKVTRVVFNRLDVGMKLQMDSTVNYTRPHRSLRLSESDIAADSPYNTYTRKGLPAGPIGNPGPRALAAAANPDPGPWLFFVLANRDGTSFFTDDYAKFLAQKNLSQATGVY